MKKLAKFLLALFLLAVLFIGLSRAYFSWFFKVMDRGELITQQVDETIPFYWSSSGHMLVDLTVNGQTYPFLLDSGASTMVFHNLLATQSLPFIGKGFGRGVGGGFFFTSIYRIEEMTLGTIQLKGVSSKSIKGLPEGFCMRSVYGILGKEVMRHLVWQIDFEKETIRIVSDKKQLSFQENVEELIVEEGRFGHHLRVDVQMGADTLWESLMVDLGYSGGIASKSSVVNQLASRRINILGSASVGLDGESKTKSAIQEVDNFQVGAIIIPDYSVYVSEGPMELMGVDFLRNFRTTLSWKDNLLLLEPYEEQDFSRLSFGINPRFDKAKNALIMKAVYEGMPAHTAGIQTGATIISMNGAAMDTEDTYCSFSFKDLEEMTITVEQEGVRQKHTLAKRAFFPEE